MAWPILEAFGLIAAILLLLYYYSMSHLNFWRKLGIKGPKPLPFVGNFKNVFLCKETTTEIFTKLYNEYKDEQMVGLYAGHEPLLLLRDLDLIKDVLIKDFPKFSFRTMGTIREVEPLSEQMFRIEPDRWKPLRTKFSPLFTSGKLKEMFHLMVSYSDELEEYLDRQIAKGGPIECREAMAKFTTDVIGACAFGFQTNALKSDDSEFREMGRRAMDTNIQQFITDRLRDYPLLFKIFGRFIVDYDMADFFVKVITQAMDYRIQNDYRRHDFVDLLTDLKADPQKYGLKEADDLFLTAQAFVFFLAGFETTSLTISHCMYELAWNPEIQDKLQAEVREAMEKTNGKITYDAVKDLKYLEACFNETLRKYPVIMWLSRTALTDYTFPGTKVTVPKGQLIYLPIYSIQRNPEIFPNPEAFDPERFMDDKHRSRHAMSYLPFGDGPRNCIGSRFARNQSKVALVKILSKYRIEVCEQTRKVYKPDKMQLFLLQPYDGVNLKLRKLVA